MLLCVLIGFFPRMAAAQPQSSGLSVRIQAGFEDQAKVGYWIPVYVEIENSGPAIRADVSITYTETASYGKTEVVQQVHLATGSRKRLTMQVPVLEMLRHVEVVVSGGGTTVAARAPLRTFPSNSLFVGVLSQNAGAMGHLAALKLPNVSPINVLHLSPGEIPDKPSLLQSLDLIVLTDFDSQQLTSDQIQSLRSWVASGGAMVVAGGPGWQKTIRPLPSDMLPVNVTGSRQVESLESVETLGGRAFGARGPFSVSTATAKAGAQVLASKDDVPIIVLHNYQSGHVLYFAADLTLDPLAQWAGNSTMWQDLLTKMVMSAGDPYVREKLMYAGRGGHQMNWALRNLPNFNIPSTRDIGIMILAYAIVVGPANYLVLKKLRRVELTWVSVPLLACVITAVAYGAGFYYTGRDVFTNTIAVATLGRGGQASVNTYVGVFAPTKRSYSLAFDGRLDVTPIASDYYHYGYPGQPSEPPVTTRITLSDTTRIEFPQMSMWTMQSVRIDEQVRLDGGISGTLLPHSTGLRGQVTNNTKLTLLDCVVVTRDSFFRLGDLKPGESATAELEAKFDPNVMHGPGVLDLMMNKGYAPYSGRVPAPPDRDMMRKRQVLSTVIGNSYEQTHSPDSAVTLLGWVETPLTTTLPKTRLKTQSPYMALVVAPLDLAIPSGEFYYPPGIVRAVVANASAGPMKAGPGFYYLGPSVTLGFQMQLPVSGERLNSLTIHIAGMHRGSGALSGQIYNYKTGAWDQWVVAIGDNPIVTPEKYVSAEGRVQFRLQTSSGDVEMRDPTASFAGRAQ